MLHLQLLAPKKAISPVTFKARSEATIFLARGVARAVLSNPLKINGLKQLLNQRIGERNIRIAGLAAGKVLDEEETQADISTCECVIMMSVSMYIRGMPFTDLRCSSSR